MAQPPTRFYKFYYSTMQAVCQVLFYSLQTEKGKGGRFLRREKRRKGIEGKGREGRREKEKRKKKEEKEKRPHPPTLERRLAPCFAPCQPKKRKKEKMKNGHRASLRFAPCP